MNDDKFSLVAVIQNNTVRSVTRKIAISEKLLKEKNYREDDAEARWKKALPAVQKALDEAISKANMATAKVDDLVRGFVTDFVSQVKAAFEEMGRTAQDIARSIEAIAPRLNKFVAESRPYIQNRIDAAILADFCLSPEEEADADVRWQKSLPHVKNALEYTLQNTNLATAKVTDVTSQFIKELVGKVKDAMIRAGRSMQDIVKAITVIAPRLSAYIDSVKPDIQRQIDAATRSNILNENQAAYKSASNVPPDNTCVESSIVDPNKLSSEFTVDEKVWEQIKPLLDSAWTHSKNASTDATTLQRNFVSSIMDAVNDMSEQFKPYIKKFYQDVAAQLEEKNEEEPKAGTEVTSIQVESQQLDCQTQPQISKMDAVEFLEYVSQPDKMTENGITPDEWLSIIHSLYHSDYSRNMPDVKDMVQVLDAATVLLDTINQNGKTARDNLQESIKVMTIEDEQSLHPFFVVDMMRYGPDLEEDVPIHRKPHEGPWTVRQAWVEMCRDFMEDNPSLKGLSEIESAITGGHSHGSLSRIPKPLTPENLAKYLERIADDFGTWEQIVDIMTDCGESEPSPFWLGDLVSSGLENWMDREEGYYFNTLE